MCSTRTDSSIRGMQIMVGVAAVLVLQLLLASQTALAEDLSAHQISVLESAAVPLYPGSIYLTGDDSAATVMWFSSDDSPDKIMDWYKDKLSGWSEMESNGSRVIYKGPPGIESKDVSSRPYVWARTTEESGVSLDSEITIRIPH